MSRGKYILWCFTEDLRIEKKPNSQEEAYKIFKNAVDSGKYRSVTLRKVERLRSYMIEHWEREDCLN